MNCPICQCTEFVDKPYFSKIQCAKCGSVPRSRTCWLLLTKYISISSSTRIAHFAPEKAIARNLFGICGNNYQPYDLDPARYENSVVEVKKLDLCREIAKLKQGWYDIVIHNHVLEHVPCNYAMVLLGLHGLIRSGGLHIFSVPMMTDYSRADLNPKFGKKKRKEIFGQWDHLRSFGRLDFDMNLGMVFGLTSRYCITDYLPEEALAQANIPERWWSPEGGCVFVVPKQMTTMAQVTG